MKKYKYIGESDETTTKGKIYNVKPNGIFIDDTNSECCLGSDYKKYFEIVENEEAKQKEKTYTEKNIDDAYDKGFKDGLNKQLDKMYSEEKVLLLLQKRDSHNITYPTTFNGGWLTPKEWLKQFKKK